MMELLHLLVEPILFHAIQNVQLNMVIDIETLLYVLLELRKEVVFIEYSKIIVMNKFKRKALYRHVFKSRFIIVNRSES